MNIMVVKGTAHTGKKAIHVKAIMITWCGSFEKIPYVELEEDDDEQFHCSVIVWW